MTKINNLPQYAEDYEYIVVREYSGEQWFWGAYNDLNKAEIVARSVAGRVLDNRRKDEPRKEIYKHQRGMRLYRLWRDENA